MNRLNVAGAAVAVAGVFAAGMAVGSAGAAQPHMQSALRSLITARAELVAALPNKGGHRANAIRLTDQAIAETRAGIAVGGR